MRRKKLKINFLSLLIILIVILLSYLFIIFVSFDLPAKDIDEFGINDLRINPAEENNLTKKGNKVAFSFVPKRDNVSGIVVYGRKHQYLFGGSSATITFKINYQKDNGEEFDFSKKIAVTSFGGTIFSINFEPLKDCKGREVFVELIADQDLEEESGLVIYNQREGTYPKVMYRIFVKEEVAKAIHNFDKDSKFFLLYRLALVVVVIPILFLLIFKIDDR